tara:strand:- start:6909 stop:8216 length:1308 start_codon:yes stop_codon:yes gene_type:complete
MARFKQLEQFSPKSEPNERSQGRRTGNKKKRVSNEDSIVVPQEDTLSLFAGLKGLIDRESFRQKYPDAKNLELIAKVLKVEIINIAIAGTNDASLKELGPKNTPIYPYRIFARNIGITFDDVSADWCFPEPCDSVYTDTANNKNNKSIESHPIYYPVLPDLKRPAPGDYIRVKIAKEDEINDNLYVGFLVSNPIPGNLLTSMGTIFRTNELKDSIPEELHASEELKLGCETKKISPDLVEQAAQDGNLNIPSKKRRGISRVSDDVRKFLLVLDSELKKAGITALVSSLFRTPQQQIEIMFKNWMRKVTDIDSQGTTSFNKANEYIDQLYSGASSSAIEKIQDAFMDYFANDTPFSEDVVNSVKKFSSHTKGTSVDISYRNGRKPDEYRKKLLKAIEKAGKQTCAGVLLESDHFHISTEKKGYTRKTLKGVKLKWV